jgi:hypothetical protein
MDVRSEELLKDKSDVRNYELDTEIEVSHKGRTFYFEIRKNVQSGTRQQTAHMFDHLKSTYCFKRAT